MSNNFMSMASIAVSDQDKSMSDVVGDVSNVMPVVVNPVAGVPNVNVSTVYAYVSCFRKHLTCFSELI
jgi:hypothetical protein